MNLCLHITTAALSNFKTLNIHCKKHYIYLIFVNFVFIKLFLQGLKFRLPSCLVLLQGTVDLSFILQV